MDWANVNLGFPHYGGTYKFGDPNGFGGINQMRAWGYNMFMSECNDFIGDGPSNDPRNKQQVWGWLEEAQVSWVNLDGKAGNVNTQIIPEILPTWHPSAAPASRITFDRTGGLGFAALQGNLDRFASGSR
ncbi:MAG: hypothetical protein U1E38_02530 [Rhodospirillales bacterium]